MSGYSNSMWMQDFSYESSKCAYILIYERIVKTKLELIENYK